jgi:hypothetical protein
MQGSGAFTIDFIMCADEEKRWLAKGEEEEDEGRCECSPGTYDWVRTNPAYPCPELYVDQSFRYHDTYGI